MRRQGFTLIELLVVVAIIAILAGIAMTTVQSVMRTGRQTKEIQAGRTLIAAYVASSADNDGLLLPGYDRTISTLPLPDGTVVSGPPAERYPYRLAPYFKNQISGTILVNDNVNQFDTTSTYLVSCYPAFGMNYLFVGGDVSATGTMTYPDECATRQAAARPIIVFASAAGDGGTAGQKISGYCILTSPKTTGQMWSTSPWKQSSTAAEYGNVDPRYNGKAICAFLDGSIRILSIDELRDMRLWSRKAQEQNNANYSIALAAPPRGR